MAFFDALDDRDELVLGDLVGIGGHAGHLGNQRR
jgi:hypothetical protein